MNFELVPVIEKMEALYNLPKSKERFEIYLNMLQGPSGSDMILPIAGYNPMGNNFVLEKLQELKSINVEANIRNELLNINKSFNTQDQSTFQVVVNLIDDVGGAWSEHCTTDYKNRFKLSAFTNRKFCIPYFWTSESYDEKLITERTRQQVFSTIYNLKYGPPFSLKDHIQQELFVQDKIENSSATNELRDFEELDQFYQNHKESEDYGLIFNFFYGDSISENLGFHKWGNKENAGFNYVNLLLNRKE